MNDTVLIFVTTIRVIILVVLLGYLFPIVRKQFKNSTNGYRGLRRLIAYLIFVGVALNLGGGVFNFVDLLGCSFTFEQIYTAFTVVNLLHSAAITFLLYLIISYRVK